MTDAYFPAMPGSYLLVAYHTVDGSPAYIRRDPLIGWKLLADDDDVFPVTIDGTLDLASYIYAVWDPTCRLFYLNWSGMETEDPEEAMRLLRDQAHRQEEKDRHEMELKQAQRAAKKLAENA